jgi:amidophosphoribosyltransferase
MCGIVGIYNRGQKVAPELYDSLIHLQHRGQDAAGILTCHNHLHKICGTGLVRDVFFTQHLEKLEHTIGIGHVRYPTSGKNLYEEIQPFWVNSPYGIAIAHNGNLVNQKELAQDLKENRHRHLNTESDTEIILNLIADNLAAVSDKTTANDFFTQLCDAITQLQAQTPGAYSIVGTIVDKGLFAFRDPHGLRPLTYGKREAGPGQYDYIFASEPTMFYALGFKEMSAIKPGELFYVDINGRLHQKTLQQKTFNPCIFEYVYFARPDSKLDDISVYRARLRMGQNLAKAWQETFPETLPDVVIPAPATSNTAALSFARYLGVRYSEGLYKNPFIGRTFIMEDNQKRRQSVRYKLCPQETEIKNKKVLILDDSIVRGITGKEIVCMVREYGAKEIYLATACPPVRFPCFYGIDIPTRQELIASNKSIDEIQSFLGVDKLLYQSLDDLVEAVTRRGDHQIDTPCAACLNNQYPCGDITLEMIEELEHKRSQQREVIYKDD